MATRFFKNVAAPVAAWALVALVLAGCATPRFAPGSSGAPAIAAGSARETQVLTPALETRILALDPKHEQALLWSAVLSD